MRKWDEDSNTVSRTVQLRFTREQNNIDENFGEVLKKGRDWAVTN